MFKRNGKKMIAIVALLAMTATVVQMPTDKVALAQVEETESYVMVDVESGEKTVIEIPEKTSEGIDALVSEPSFLENNASGAAADLLGGTGANTRSVIGTDNRTRVSNANVYPYTAVARLDITCQDGGVTYGSGALIGSRILATAGHVLIDGNGNLPKSLKVEFGKNGSSTYYTTSNVKSYIYKADYGTKVAMEDDYTFVIFNEDVGAVTGYFGIDTSISFGNTVYTAGYPQDMNIYGNDMYVSSGLVVNVTDDLLYYTADTSGGNSGSPVYVIKSGKPYVVGIHTRGKTAVDSGGEANSGRRINSNLYSWLKSVSYVG